MTISANDIREYFTLTFSNLDQEELSLKVKTFKEKVDNKIVDLKDYFLIRNESGVPVAASWMFSVEAEKYGFQSPKFIEKNSSDLHRLFSEIKERFNELKGLWLKCRVVHDENYDFLKEEMQNFGFKVIGDRVEYKTLINEIDQSTWGESPIRWTAPLVDESMTLDEVASFMETVAKGDPDYDPETDNAKECIESYLAEKGLYIGKDCVQVGFIDEKPCAFIVAQVEPSTGWSRITYMAVHPDFRGRGLGVWVQRYGIQLLEKQGGTEYHGGTNFDNKGMQSVFEKNGCKRFRRLTEWKL